MREREERERRERERRERGGREGERERREREGEREREGGREREGERGGREGERERGGERGREREGGERGREGGRERGGEREGERGRERVCEKEDRERQSMNGYIYNYRDESHYCGDSAWRYDDTTKFNIPFSGFSNSPTLVPTYNQYITCHAFRYCFFSRCPHGVLLHSRDLGSNRILQTCG